MNCMIPKIMVNQIYHPYLKVGAVDDGVEWIAASECFRLFEDKERVKRIQMENLDERLSKLQKAEHFGDDVDKPHRLD